MSVEILLQVLDWAAWDFKNSVYIGVFQGLNNKKQTLKLIVKNEKESLEVLIVVQYYLGVLVINFVFCIFLIMLILFLILFYVWIYFMS